MHLQHAEACSLTKHPRPRSSIELVLPLIHFERIRAVRAAKRTTMREFGEETERIVERSAGACAGSAVGAAVGGHGITTPAASCRRDRAATPLHRPAPARGVL